MIPLKGLFQLSFLLPGIFMTAESEGSQVMQNAYLNSCTLRAMASIDEKKYNKAQDELNAALHYSIGLYGRSRYAQLDYMKK